VVDVINGWRKANANLLYWIFGGSDESIDMLWTMISDAKLLNRGHVTEGVRNARRKNLEAAIKKTFHAYAIPDLWQRERGTNSLE
jgi:hypothetical protein